MQYKGKIISWNDDRGFGFIERNDGSDRVFAHISSFSDRNQRPSAGTISLTPAQVVFMTLEADKVSGVSIYQSRSVPACAMFITFPDTLIANQHTERYKDVTDKGCHLVPKYKC